MFGIFSLVATVLAGAFQTISNYKQNRAAEKAAEYNAAVEEKNAELARQQGNFAEEKQREEARRIQSKARATGIQSGIASGTFFDVMGQSALGAEIDAITTRYNYEVKAVDHENKASMYRYQANGYRRNAKSSILGGIFNTAASSMSVAYDYFGGSK